MNKPATKPNRRQRNRAAAIAEILAAARAQMRAEGAAALNLNTLARDIGIRTPSLYEYFPGGKHAIYDALFAEGFTLFGDLMRASFTHTDPWERLRHSFEQYLTFATTYPELYQLCFERPVPGFTPSAESMQISLGVLAESQAVTEDFIAQVGLPPGLSVVEVRDLLIAAMHGIAAQHLANEPQLPPGTGRFGSLIPALITTLRRAWSSDLSEASTEGGSHQ